MLKDEWIGLFDTLRSCVFSPTGLIILAQGKAKRSPGYATCLIITHISRPQDNRNSIEFYETIAISPPRPFLGERGSGGGLEL